jgi:hypothetical protein
MKRLLIWALLFVGIAALFPSVALAQDGITVISSDADAAFPYSVTFTVEATAMSTITEIDLEYRVDRRSLVSDNCRVALDFTPDKQVTVNWTWDMLETGGLPTGTEIEYWWLIEDEAGNTIETEPETVEFDDLRYDWHSETSGQVTFYWYEGDGDFAQELIDAADDALGNLADEFGFALGQPADFYIYANSWELQGALIYPDEWTGGMAFPDYSTVVIGISPDNLTWGQRAIAHELGHLVVHQAVYGPFGVLPTWLDEGLAMSAEGELRWDLQSVFDAAVARNAIFSVRSITSSFPASSGEAELCYAESYSLVEYLRDNYGGDKILDLLGVFAQGSTVDQALIQIYGFDMDGLDRVWRESLGLDPENPGYPSSYRQGVASVLTAPYIVLFVLVAILGIMTVYLGYLYARRVM